MYDLSETPRSRIFLAVVWIIHRKLDKFGFIISSLAASAGASRPLIRIILMLFNRDPCLSEFFSVFAEPENLISYNLQKFKDCGIIESYYRSNHKIYKLKEEAAPGLKKIASLAAQ
jgi:DNA-binding transcriptional ArsR family regulator